MAEEEFDPLDLMSRAALLVLEARTPDCSPKGRIEGPHCPGSELEGQHHCSREMQECQRALEFRQQLTHMWRNGIPSCIDIMLFPDCVHGVQEAQSLEGAGCSVQENSLLLERWNIEALKKRHGEWRGGVAGSMLLQAVRSWLFFSQLSSWLASTEGRFPNCIGYRLYAPGEEAGIEFTQQPQPHLFPPGIYGRHALKVKVLVLPRQRSVPALPCAVGVPWGQSQRPRKSCQAAKESRGSAHSDSSDGDSGPHTDFSTGAQWSGPRQHRPAPSRPQATGNQPLPVCSAQNFQASKFGTSFTGWHPPGGPAQGGFHGGDGGMVGKSASREALESQLRPLQLTAPNASPALDLHSPKVLMSDVQHIPVTVRMKGKKLNLSSPEGVKGAGRHALLHYLEDESLCLNPDSLEGPLSPLDMQTLYANLQSLTAPIPHPPEEPPLSFQLKAQTAAKLKQFGDGMSGYYGSKGKSSERFPDASEKHSARFRKKKALPFGGDPPLPGSSESSIGSSCFETSNRSQGQESDFLLKNLPFYPHRKGQDSTSHHSDFFIRRKAIAKEAKEKEENRTAKTCTSNIDGFDLSEELRLSTPVSRFKNSSSSATFQHSTKYGLSQSINQTLRDINKIVSSSTVQAQRSSDQRKSLEASQESLSSSLSSSSSSSTYSSSPRVASEDGGRHSDSSTPTNLSSSPLPDEPQPMPCQSRATTSRSPLVSPDPASTQDGPDFNTDRYARKTSLQMAADSANSLFSESSVKDLVKQPQDQHQQMLYSQEVDTAERDCGAERNGCVSTSEAGSSWCVTTPLITDAINLNLPPVQRPTLQQFVEHDSHLHLPTTEQTTLNTVPDKGLHPPLTYQTAQDHVALAPLTSCKQENSADSFLSRKLRRDTEYKEAASTCSFYLESPPSPESMKDWALQCQGTPQETCLVSSLEKLNLKQVEGEELSTQSEVSPVSETTDNWSQSQDSGFIVSDTSVIRSLSQSSGFDGGVSQSDLTEQQSESVKDACSACEHPQFKDKTGCKNSIEHSSIAHTCQGNQDSHRQHCSSSSLEIPATVSTCFADKTPYTNGTHKAARPVVEDSTQLEDSVFYEREEDAQRNSSRQCPTRTKSAPSFSTLSAKSRLGNEENGSADEMTRGRSLLRDKDAVKMAGSERLRHRLLKSASMMFNSRGSLPSQSSPAPVKRRSTGHFDFDETLTNTKAIKGALSMSRLSDVSKDSSDDFTEPGRILSTSAPASTNCLLGNFEESILNGRLEPAGMVEGFSVDIGASGSFCPRHLSLPVTAYFFNLSDDNAPSPYLGHINLDGVGKRGYHIPNKGTLQVTLFNPNKTVVKMFVVKYDLEDMPANCQTVIRQRTVYRPADPDQDLPSYLRYLIHLRVCSSSSGKIYLHTDVRLIFARNNFELDSSVAQYKLHSFTETPVNPKYSPKR